MTPPHTSPLAGERELERLERERDEADKRYNDALTAVDRSLHRLPEFPAPPPPLDEHQITPLNRLWNILPDRAPGGSGWRGRFVSSVWRVIAPMLQTQQEFNSALVDHVNRNVTIHREVGKAIESTIAVMRDQLGAVVTFQTHLIVFLQQITPYVDTKDRGVAGRMIGLSAAISGVADEMLKRWESMRARDERYAAKLADLEQVRTTLGVLQQANLTLKREVERIIRTSGASHPAAVAASVCQEMSPGAPTSGLDAVAGLDSYKYVGFEDQFRGSQDDIRRRVAEYLPELRDATDVLDLGCGRGEFLDLLREHGISARGLDINHEMIEVCLARGLDAVEGDGLAYLTSLPDGSLGGLFAAQVVEHLQPDYLVRLLEVAFHKLRPGSRIILETINPACWSAFFDSYIRDITHVRPLHPDTLEYLLTASGFSRVEVRYRAPYPEHARLRSAPTSLGGSSDRAGFDPELADAFNENVARLNSILFTFMDYAAIGSR